MRPLRNSSNRRDCSLFRNHLPKLLLSRCPTLPTEAGYSPADLGGRTYDLPTRRGERGKGRVISAMCGILIMSAASAASAQTFTSLADLDGTDGSNPYYMSLVRLPWSPPPRSKPQCSPAPQQGKCRS